MGFDRFSRVQMLEAHQLHWRVGADRDRGEVRRAEPATDQAEQICDIGGIAGAVEALAAPGNARASPKGAVAARQIATTVMLRGQERQRKFADQRLLPPIMLFRRRTGRLGELMLQPETDDKARRPTLPPRKQADRVEIEMVIVVVGDQHGVTVAMMSTPVVALELAALSAAVSTARRVRRAGPVLGVFPALMACSLR